MPENYITRINGMKVKDSYAREQIGNLNSIINDDGEDNPGIQTIVNNLNSIINGNGEDNPGIQSIVNNLNSIIYDTGWQAISETYITEYNQGQTELNQKYNIQYGDGGSIHYRIKNGIAYIVGCNINITEVWPYKPSEPNGTHIANIIPNLATLPNLGDHSLISSISNTFMASYPLSYLLPSDGSRHAYLQISGSPSKLYLSGLKARDGGQIPLVCFSISYAL